MKTRKSRGLSQTDLAMTELGVPISKTGLLRLERVGQERRTLGLDEALCFAAALQAAPVHLLSPVDGELVRVSKAWAFDGDGLRSWLRHGDAFREVFDSRSSAARDAALISQAHKLVDAYRGIDKAGLRDAVAEIVRIARSKP